MVSRQWWRWDSGGSGTVVVLLNILMGVRLCGGIWSCQMDSQELWVQILRVGVERVRVSLW